MCYVAWTNLRTLFYRIDFCQDWYVVGPSSMAVVLFFEVYSGPGEGGFQRPHGRDAPQEMCYSLK